jgi:hypothetical protein
MKKKITQLKKLYLDDVRNPKTEGWTIVRNYDEFVKYINENGLPDEISFDHDLGENTKTGYDCAKWFCEYCWGNGLPIPNDNVHSANPVGRDNIIQILKSFERKLND